MSDETPAAAPEGTPIDSIEDKLGAFDFDAQAPAGAEGESAPGDGEAAAPLAGETVAEKPAADDDPEYSLRDNRKVRLSELKRGYRPDWETESRKFAEQQEQFKRETAGFSQAQQQMAGMLQHAVTVMQARLPKAPDLALLESDPFEYQKQKALHEAGVAEIDRLSAMRNHQIQQAQQQRQQEWQRYKQQEFERMIHHLPELKDSVKGAQFQKDAVQTMAKYGYTQAEIMNAVDHRAFRVAHDLLRLKKYDEAAARAKAKLAAAPQVPVEVQSPQKRRTPGQVESDSNRARMERLRRNPNNPKAAEDILSRLP